jgi:ubiquinone/menaquinone biosynthesis C-methylase UbiE
LIPLMKVEHTMYRICVPLLLLATATISSAQDASPQETPATDPQSVKPGINDRFIDPELNVKEWIDRFEVESREVYHARKEIMRHLKLQPGDRIADVGAGTGFFTLLMSKAVSPDGWAYAVDISPKFVEHLVKQFDGRSINNVTTVMCDDDSVCLPPASIDVAFICDVYHHFEYPGETMKSIRKALVDKGRVVVIDFERIPGVSREWTLGHVRADRQTFIDEIQSAGFELIAQREIAGFKENYYLEFRKK